MKFVYILTTLLFLSKTSRAQSFADTTKLWNVAQCSAGPFGSSCFTASYKLMGDTTVGQYQYKKIYKTLDTALASWTLRGAMRDSGQKVFYTDFLNEYLLYDFDANVGDTIRSILFCQDTLLIVDSVDTILVDGVTKRRLLFNFPGCTYREVWIEDIGSVHGIINQTTVYGNLVADLGEDLLCYWQNDTVRWINPVYNDCYYVTLGISERNLVIPKLFPNPVNDISTIELDGINGAWNWQLYNIYGQVVQSTDNIKNSQYEIKRGGLPAGVYFYYIDSKNSIVTKGKLIIN